MRREKRALVCFRSRSRRRRGAAAVEMAIVTPLLLLLVFGIIEYGWMFMVSETVTNATREATRSAILQGASRADVIQRFRDAMSTTGLVDGAVTDGETSDPCGEGQECADWVLTVPSQAELDDPTDGVVEVTVTVPNDKVSIAGLGAFVGLTRDVGSTCSMRKEGYVSGG